MKFHKLRDPSLTVMRSAHYYWLARKREKKKSDPVTSVRPLEETPFALSYLPLTDRCVIFKGMYVSCGRRRRREEGWGRREERNKQRRPNGVCWWWWGRDEDDGDGGGGGGDGGGGVKYGFTSPPGPRLFLRVLSPHTCTSRRVWRHTRRYQHHYKG